MRKNKPKKEYGYYCDVCGRKICKYLLDFKNCGGLWVSVWDPNQIDRVMQDKEICEDCAKNIMEELLDSHGL